MFTPMVDPRTNSSAKRRSFSAWPNHLTALTRSYFGFFGRSSLESEKNENVERVAGIEPASQAWKASALPLSYTRPQAQRPAIIALLQSTLKRGLHKTDETASFGRVRRSIAAYRGCRSARYWIDG